MGNITQQVKRIYNGSAYSSESESKFVKIFIDNKPYVSKKLKLQKTLSQIRIELEIPDCYSYLLEDCPLHQEEELTTAISEVLQNGIELQLRTSISSQKTTLPLLSQNISSANTSQDKPSNTDLPTKKTPLKSAQYIGMHENGYRVFQYPHILPKANKKFPNCSVMDSLKLEKAKYAIVLGETGVGKSTQLNSLVNFLQGVEIDDDFRYQLISESSNNDQSKSQTSSANIYCVESQIGYPPVVIIDTPGYGDTRGIEKDHQIDQMLHNLFTKEVEKIHLVCFVTKSSSARLTATQNYVFNKVLTMFGKDIAENFLFVLTFCDGGDPIVIKSLEVSPIIAPVVKQIKDEWSLKFNNSAIFAKYKEGDTFQKFYWDLCSTSMQVFMKRLGNISEKSLTMSREVIRERKSLDTRISGLQFNLAKGLAQVASLEGVLDQFAQNFSQMKDNQNYIIEVEEPTVIQQQLPKSMFTTLCLTCNRTCHRDCGIIPPENKERCIAMEGGNCTICPGKCHHSSHINSEYEIILGTKKVSVTQKELEQRYKSAIEGLNSREKVVYGLINEIEDIQLRCLDIQEQLRVSIEKLNQIALRPNCFKTTADYIEQLIFNEEENKQKGWQARVSALKEIKKKNDIADQMIQNDHTQIFKPKSEMLQKLIQEGALKNSAENVQKKSLFMRFFACNS
jgi:GTP-binding protein EngB required for normal cell division